MLTPEKLDNVVPIIIWRAIPGTLINVRPPDQWYIAEEMANVSKVIDPAKVRPVQKTDFSDRIKIRDFKFTGSTFFS